MFRLLVNAILRTTKHLQLPHKVKWEIGALDETAFWDDHLRSHYVPVNGLAPSEEGRFRTDPQSPLQGDLAALVEHVTDPVIRILDVGCGPFSRVGKVIPGRTMELTAVDPLADRYARLYKKHGIRPPVLPIKGAGEDLRSRFPASHFHLAHANNCLDHGYDPVESVKQMVEVVVPGGYVFLRHEANVAEVADYVGMHQWNFSKDGSGAFIISDKKRAVNMNEALASVATVESRMSGTFIISVIRKH